MKKILFFVVLITFSIIGSQAQTLTKDEGAVIKVMSYNIHHGNPPAVPDKIDLVAIASVIKKANPDLVALQEVDVHTTRSGKDLHETKQLAELTGMHYYFFKSIDVYDGAYGNAILSKYPIVHAEGHILPMKSGLAGEQRSVAIIKIEPVSGKAVLFASTHLDLKKPHREIQATTLVDLFKDRVTPVVLCGDFNDVEGSVPLTILDKEFERTCSGQECPGTIPVDSPKRTIDFIMYHPKTSMRVKSSTVIAETYASDHRPVLAELYVK